MKDTTNVSKHIERDSQLHCRFYEEEYPKVQSFVKVHVTQISDMGAYVKLLEYGDVEGMIQFSELSRLRIRSFKKVIQIGDTVIAKVIQLDKEKGYIDLSKKSVSMEDATLCEERYQKTRAVVEIMRQLAITTGNSLLELNQRIAWPLNKDSQFGKSCFDAFRISIQEPDLVWSKVNITPKEKKIIQVQICKRLSPKLVKIRADVHVMCFKSEGIEAVKTSLLAGIRQGTKEIPVSIRLIYPPLYVIFVSSFDGQVGINLVEKVLIAITDKILEMGGAINVINSPRITSVDDDNNLESLLKKMELEKSGSY